MKYMFPVPVLGAVASLAVPVYSFGQQQQPQVRIHIGTAAPNPAQVVAVGRTVRGEVADLFQRQDPGGGSSLVADLRTDTGQIVSVDLGKSNQISPSPQPVRGEWLAALGTLVRVNDSYYLFPDHASDVARISPIPQPGEATPAGAQLPASQSLSQQQQNQTTPAQSGSALQR